MSRRATIFSMLLLVLLPIVLILTLAKFQIGSSERLSASRAAIVHAFTVVRTAQTLRGAVKDAERGQRGFLLTNNPKYLGPYHRGVAEIPHDMSELRALTAGNSDLQLRLSAIQTDISAKLAELSATIDAANHGDTAGALRIVRSDNGETIMDAFMAAVNGLIDAENTLLRQSLDQADRADATARFAMLAGSGLAALLFAVGSFVLYRAYAENRRARKALQATLDSVREGVGAFDARRRLVALNQLFADIVGLPAGFAKRGRSLEELVAVAAEHCHWIGEELPDLDRRARHTGHPLIVERSCNDGRIIELYQNPLRGGGFVTTLTDVTEARQREAFVRQAHKMESIGQLTGGVAHDFNNLLTIVLGSLETLRRRCSDDEKALSLIDRGLAGVGRGAKLTQQLLSFARKQPPEPQIVNLGDILPELVDLLNKTIGEHVEIQAVGTGGLWNTFIDTAQFESAVLNLALNARDAMPDGGRLTIELGNAALDAAYASHHDEVAAGQYVMLAVTDTGTGMPPEVVARAFDPFFTTKEEGRGTGLGLSQVYGFAKQSGGHVKIYSELGHGTTVRLYLPRHAGTTRPTYERPSHSDLSGDETVLVVEDDADVRATVVSMLRDLGYRVLEAPHGAAALSLLENPGRIDLLFSDVVMPGAVTSKVLAANAAAMRPEIKILFTSGYTENAIVHNGRLDDGVQLISKPYRRDQLAAKLRNVLAMS